MKRVVLLMCVFAFFLGCIATGGVEKNEKVLGANTGIGVLEFRTILQELPPGGQSYMSMVVRNNIDGAVARNVTVQLDNIYPFYLLNCTGGIIKEDELMMKQSKYDPDKKCATMYPYDYDTGLGMAQHGIKELYPGDEYDFLWGYQAPENAIIKGIYYKHQLYYTLEYDYSVANYFNVMAMSSQESLRRQRGGEALVLSTTSDTSAADVKVDVSAQQVLYNLDGEALENYFTFKLTNMGVGVLSGDKVSNLTVIIPYNVDVLYNVKSDELTQLSSSESDVVRTVYSISPTAPLNKDYGWKQWVSITKDGEFLGGELSASIDPETLIGQAVYTIPYKQADIVTLQSARIPIQTYTFFILLEYRYSIEGSIPLYIRPLIAEAGEEI